MPVVPSNNVYPSGSLAITRLMPTMPPAPVAFSTITGCPSNSLIRAPMMRPTVSNAPPAANGTTSVIGRDGYVCAYAASGEKMATTAIAAR